MPNKIGKKILGVVLFIAQWYILYRAMSGTAWAWNVFRFTAWLFTVMCFLALLVKEKLSKEVPERTLPAWFAIGSDVIISCVLAAFGHFFYAGLVIFQMFLEAALFHKEEKCPSESSPSTPGKTNSKGYTSTGME